MRLSDFNYNLPKNLIARYPRVKRGSGRLLVINFEGKPIADHKFRDLLTFINKNDLIVFNDTKVIKARLYGFKESGGKIEILIERIIKEDIALAHIRASKSPRPGTKINFSTACVATVIERNDNLFKLQFSSSVESYLSRYGEIPIPGYLKRAPNFMDEKKYQTLYAANPGAVAAPTAGLHFNKKMIGEIKKLQLNHEFITLHVGAGSFQNIHNENIEKNKLHSERVEVSQKTCDAIKAVKIRGGRIFAVGTTTVRALETASKNGDIQPYFGETDIFIKPNYNFKIVDALLTNFHLPKSSLIMLVSAFAGTEQILNAYKHAVKSKYLFYSYGDAMLVFPKENQS